MDSLFSKNELLGRWYESVMLDPETIFRRAGQISTLKDVMEVLRQLETDAYSEYLFAYLSEGLRKFGSSWSYLDILHVLGAAAALIQPRSYLEVGVRRGRSMAMVVRASPETDLYGFDTWEVNYAGMNNPGVKFVESEMRKIGALGKINLITGNSHETLPAFFSENPDIEFDLVTVDGDHTPEGSKRDLMDVMPHVSQGGCIVFDDINHPLHPHLHKHWISSLQNFGTRFRSLEYTGLGYGVAIAIRCTG